MKRIEHFPVMFGRRVKERRTSLGLTQAALIAKLEEINIRVTQGYISLLEAGQRKEPSIQLVVSLAIILDISIDKLIFEEEG